MFKAYTVLFFLAFCVVYSKQGLCKSLAMKPMSTKDVKNIFEKSGHKKVNGSLIMNTCHGSGFYYTYTPEKLTSHTGSIDIEMAFQTLAYIDGGSGNGIVQFYNDNQPWSFNFNFGVSCSTINYKPCPLPVKKDDWFYLKTRCSITGYSITYKNTSAKAQIFNYADELVTCLQARVV
ncbi:uncharacterized protein [Antedon mediterranea]|uniref:uncharacterized protein n=1 Tax=Antedon mediterranea TaxID=105859 RepID=UPI003AF53793